MKNENISQYQVSFFKTKWDDGIDGVIYIAESFWDRELKELNDHRKKRDAYYRECIGRWNKEKSKKIKEMGIKTNRLVSDHHKKMREILSKLLGKKVCQWYLNQTYMGTDYIPDKNDYILS